MNVFENLSKENIREIREIRETEDINCLAMRIVDCLSDGYDDEEYREETVLSLYNELSQITGDGYIKSAFVRMCERIEELED